MHREGFEALSGVDPLIKQDIVYRCGLRIQKKQIEELGESYDLIMLHHSFEHMTQPLSVLKALRRILRGDGQLILRIPLVDCHACRKYGACWVQLDAPRHYYLQTVRSIHIQCGEAGFEISDIEYDSGAMQFAASEKYLRDIALVEDRDPCSKKQHRLFKAEARRLNAIRDGDSACFYLRPRS
jgi:predicted SAM-dependent methyltransferase